MYQHKSKRLWMHPEDALRLPFFLLMLPVLFSSVSVRGQSASDRSIYSELYGYVSDEYGFDQVLVNGISYTDKYWKKEGHQFFPEDRSYNGNLLFRGKEYKGLEIKYDICNQQVIVYIDNISVGVVPPDDFISAFSLGNRLFSKYNFRGKPEFYEIIFNTDKLKCYYHWYKDVQETCDNGYSEYYYYEFSDSKRYSYLYIDGSLKLYGNNKSFTGLLPPEVRPIVSKYLKKYRLKVTKSGNDDIIRLLTFCQSLL